MAMIMTSQGAICASMKVTMSPRRPRNRIRARAKAANRAMTSEHSTEQTVTVTELRTSVQKWSACTARSKWPRVTSVGNHTGFSAMMSPVGLKAVANIQ